MLGPSIAETMNMKTRFGLFTLLLVPALTGLPASGSDEPKPLFADPIGAPMRIRDFTFPSYALLNFAPQPAAALGKGKWALEAQHSIVNNFQVSSEVEDYLAGARGEDRRPLDALDAEFILGLSEGDGFYIDGEFQFTELLFHYGVTNRLDLGVGLLFVNFSGGFLDGTIFDFHDSFGYGQQGRDLVADDQFQIVIGQDGTGLALLDGPASGGVSDPSLYFRYFLGSRGRWKFNLGGGVKVPIADDDGLLSSGGLDYGAVLTADARLQKTAYLFNLSIVEAEKFSLNGVDPPLLTSLHVSWIRTLGRSRKTRLSVQLLAAEHAFRELLDSEISELEVQVTLAIKRSTPIGILGFGLTENLLAYDNTPDIGVHLSWGYLSK